jgi:hypothetical protein
VISAKRCPFTGVVNLFVESEPHIAAGAIARCGTSAATPGFTWRCLTSEAELSGYAPDLETAQFRLTALLDLVAQNPQVERR